MSREMNFYSSKTTKEDAEDIFGPMEETDGPLVQIDMENITLGHLMHQAGLFPSIKQAKNNGWNNPIPQGYSEYSVGKKKFGIFIWNPSCSLEEWNAQHSNKEST